MGSKWSSGMTSSNKVPDVISSPVYGVSVHGFAVVSAHVAVAVVVLLPARPPPRYSAWSPRGSETHLTTAHNQPQPHGRHTGISGAQCNIGTNNKQGKLYYIITILDPAWKAWVCEMNIYHGVSESCSTLLVTGDNCDVTRRNECNPSIILLQPNL